MMSIEIYIEKMRKIQENLLDFIENEDDNLDQSFQKLKQMLLDTQIQSNIYEFKSFLHLVNKVSNNHHRKKNFISNIEKILNLFKNEITKYFSNAEIFNIFAFNKRVLLFLFDEKIIVIDYYIVQRILSIKLYNSEYREYFSKEIKQFLKDNKIKTKNINSLKSFIDTFPDVDDEKRRIGENDSYICELIRNDSITDFIIYINKNNISLDSDIPISIYETNFLLREPATLIEYAAFFGSIQIFNYLKANKVELTPSLWLYSISSNNAEMIHLLEENNVKFPYDSYYYFNEEEEEEEVQNEKKCEQCVVQSIKCHHNDITKYFLNNYCDNSSIILNQSIECYNFLLIQNDDIDKSLFHKLCKNDYYILADILLKTTDININEIDVF